jgi:hypothetical protein
MTMVSKPNKNPARAAANVLKYMSQLERSMIDQGPCWGYGKSEKSETYVSRTSSEISSNAPAG